MSTHQNGVRLTGEKHSIEPMNDVMHVVAKIWYRLYLGVILLCSVVVAAGRLASAFMPSLANLEQNFAFNTPMLIMAALVILYCVTFYWPLDKRNPAMAMFGATLLFTLILVGGLTLSQSTTGLWLYVIGWIASTAFVGMYG